MTYSSLTLAAVFGRTN